MSIVGLYDADMVTYTHVPFNLDLMKLSTYYKKKRDIVTLKTDTDLSKISKLIYRKDYYNDSFDSNLLLNDKVEYGGRAFNQDLFIPMDEEIERCKPDTYIYKSMAQNFGIDKTSKGLFKQMTRAQHLRLSLDGKTVWKDWRCQINNANPHTTYIFHDYNLADIKGSLEVLKQIYEENEAKAKIYYGFKFPIQLYDSSQLVEWAQFYPTTKFYTIQFNGLMNDQDLINFVEKQKTQSICSNTIYNVTYGCKNLEDFKKRLLPLYKQIVYLRSHRQTILLKYDDTIFSDKRWCRLLDLFKMYLAQSKTMSKDHFDKIINFDSLYNAVSHFEDGETYKFHFKDIETPLMLIDEARELFQMVREQHYDLFQAFYECHVVYMKGGTFHYDKHPN